MTKQLLIYESAVPVSAARHGTVSLEPGATTPSAPASMPCR